MSVHVGSHRPNVDGFQFQVQHLESLLAVKDETVAQLRAELENEVAKFQYYICVHIELHAREQNCPRYRSQCPYM